MTIRERYVSRRRRSPAASRARSRSPRPVVPRVLPPSSISIVLERFADETSNPLNPLHNNPTRRRAIFTAGSEALDDLMNVFLGSRNSPMNTAKMNELPKVTIAAEQTELNCSICFDDFKLEETETRKLPCNHLFHEKCIFPWLQINGTCPVCRKDLTNGASGSGESSRRPERSSELHDLLQLMRERRVNRRNQQRTVDAMVSAGTGTGSQEATTIPTETGSTAIQRRFLEMLPPVASEARDMRRRRRRRRAAQQQQQVDRTASTNRLMRELDDLQTELNHMRQRFDQSNPRSLNAAVRSNVVINLSSDSDSSVSSFSTPSSTSSSSSSSSVTLHNYPAELDQPPNPAVVSDGFNNNNDSNFNMRINVRQMNRLVDDSSSTSDSD